MFCCSNCSWRLQPWFADMAPVTVQPGRHCTKVKSTHLRAIDRLGKIFSVTTWHLPGLLEQGEVVFLWAVATTQTLFIIIVPSQTIHLIKAVLIPFFQGDCLQPCFFFSYKGKVLVWRTNARGLNETFSVQSTQTPWDPSLHMLTVSSFQPSFSTTQCVVTH